MGSVGCHFVVWPRDFLAIPVAHLSAKWEIAGR
jgi:hypothetical protein